MKTKRQSPVARRIFTTLGIAALLAWPSTGIAQQKGAETLLKLNRLQATEDLQSVQPGDRVVMSCPKCKDIWVKVVAPTFKAANPQEQHLVKQHQCPGCGSERVTTGHGKAKITEIVHVCTTCGSTNANCCVMKAGAGPTRGKTQD